MGKQYSGGLSSLLLFTMKDSKRKLSCSEDEERPNKVARSNLEHAAPVPVQGVVHEDGSEG